MKKEELTEKLESWLDNFLKKKFTNYNIEILTKAGFLNRSANQKLQKLANISFLEFEPDILGILEEKMTKEIELVFLQCR